ncbi:MAG TPA: metallophosphoesterase [Cyclobacteriaceae bacterium]|nr:metallophosphoesterase [Cyclobacteriaceae bacterium]
MKVLLITDVHGNLPALEKLLAKEKDHDLIVSLGDVVDYGPWSNECVALLTHPGVVNLVGNHEEYFIHGAFPYPEEYKLVHKFFDTCYPGFRMHDIIKTYRQEYTIGEFSCRHTVGNLYVFKDTAVEIDTNMFIGHSHQQFRRMIGPFQLVNPGSVGQNRGEINVVNYATYDVTAAKIELKELVYDVDIVIREMKAKNYPEECINYYRQKPVRK